MGWTGVHEEAPRGHVPTKNQPHEIILALDLIALMFSVLLTIDFFDIQSFKPMVDKGLMIVKLGLVPDDV